MTSLKLFKTMGMVSLAIMALAVTFTLGWLAILLHPTYFYFGLWFVLIALAIYKRID